MFLDPMPINQFVHQRYLTQTIQKIVESWRVEPQLVIEHIVEHFKQMGVFRVYPGHERIILRSMVNQLKVSPDLAQLVARAHTDEIRRQRNRHAD